jgi:hypothetical protein
MAVNSAATRIATPQQTEHPRVPAEPMVQQHARRFLANFDTPRDVDSIHERLMTCMMQIRITII